MLFPALLKSNTIKRQLWCQTSPRLTSVIDCELICSDGVKNLYLVIVLCFLLFVGQRYSGFTAAFTLTTTIQSHWDIGGPTPMYSSSAGGSSGEKTTTKYKSDTPSKPRVSLEESVVLPDVFNNNDLTHSNQSRFRGSQYRAAILLSSLGMVVSVAVLIGIRICLRRHRADVRRAMSATRTDHRELPQTRSTFPQAYPGQIPDNDDAILNETVSLAPEQGSRIRTCSS